MTSTLVNDPALHDPALARDAEALHAVLTRLIRVYRFRDREVVCCYGVSAAQCHALQQLATHGPSTLNDFAAALFLEKSSASRMVDGMVRNGLVRRDRNPDDGRSRLLGLTEEGASLAAKLEADMLAERRLVLDGLDPAERDVVIKAVGRLADQAVACCTPEQQAQSC